MSENAKLSEEKLYECFKSLNVPVRLADLKTPTKDFVLQVFHTFLKDLQINIANVISFESIQHLDNPDYCEVGQMYFVLISILNEILGKFCALEITLSDVMSPKPKRTKRIFNYLIVFWTYYLQRVAAFESVEKHLQPEIEKLADLKRHNELLEENYLECVAKSRDVLPSKKEIQKSYLLKDEQVKNLEQVRKEVLEKYQALKEEENQLHAEISGADIAVVNAKEKLSELDQLIVSSPEKKKVEIQKLKDMTKEIEQTILEKELTKKERENSYSSLVLAQEDFVKNFTRQQAILDELQLSIEKARDVCLLDAKHKEEKQNLNALMSTQEMKEAITNVYEQKCSKVQLSKKKQIEEISETLMRLQRPKEEEKRMLEKKKLYKTQLENRINKEAESIFDVVKQCQSAEVETERVKTIYVSEMQVINESFRNSCKDIITEVKRVYE